MALKKFFNKSIATALSLATLLTTVSPCTSARENYSKGKNEKSLSTTAKTAIVGAGAVVIGTVVGITTILMRNTDKEPVCIDNIPDEDLKNAYTRISNTITNYNNNDQSIKQATETIETIISENQDKPGFNLNLSAGDNKTPLLYMAAGKNMYDVCSLLLDNGANVNAPDHNGNTPLHIAVVRGYHNLCELLLHKNGINVNAVAKNENDYFTPLDLVGDNKLIIENMLIENGAKHFVDL